MPCRQVVPKGKLPKGLWHRLKILAVVDVYPVVSVAWPLHQIRAPHGKLDRRPFGRAVQGLDLPEFPTQLDELPKMVQVPGMGDLEGSPLQNGPTLIERGVGMQKGIGVIPDMVGGK